MRNHTCILPTASWNALLDKQVEHLICLFMMQWITTLNIHLQRSFSWSVCFFLLIWNARAWFFFLPQSDVTGLFKARFSFTGVFSVWRTDYRHLFVGRGLSTFYYNSGNLMNSLKLVIIPPSTAINISAVSMPHQFPTDLESFIFHLTLSFFANSNQIVQPLFYIGSVCQVPKEAECTAVRSGSRLHSRRTMSFESENQCQNHVLSHISNPELTQ